MSRRLARALALARAASPRSLAVLALAPAALGLALAGCNHPTDAAAPAASTAMTAALADPARPADDLAADAERKPQALMAFAGVAPGMKVVELAPGGGYYTRLLSLAVGPQGKVYALGKAPALADWAAAHPQVALGAIDPATPLAPEPVDLVWTTQNYHDFENKPAPSGNGTMATQIDAAAFAALKPGGVYLVNDHAAAPNAPADVTSTLHRIQKDRVIREVEAAGFRLAGESDALANPLDDHTLKVFDPAIRGHTDQFVLKFVKP